MENKKLDQILNVVLEVVENVAGLKAELNEVKENVSKLEKDLKAEIKDVKEDVAKIKVQLKELKEIAIENRTDFMLTKEYIEKRDREVRKEKLENEKYKEEQKIQTEALRNKVSEIDQRVDIDDIKIEKLFILETANMLARQAQ